MAKLGNVVQMNHNNDEQNVYGTIHTFLTRKAQNSVNTKETYERAIRDFFRTMRNKELEQLLPEDLTFSKKQVESYQVALKEQYKSKTVNNAMSAIRECYKRLKDDGFEVDLNWFNLERYKESDSEKYSPLSHEEVMAIIQFVSNTRKGSEKALLVELAYATAFRKESLMTLEKKQIININDIWYVKVLGKNGEWSHKKISNGLYTKIMSHLEATGKEKVFSLTDKTINKMMNLIRESFDFGGRRIVFHSFKKASLEELNIRSGGDLKALQAHGDHKNAQTTINHYLANKEIEDLVMIDIDTHVPVEKFDCMSQEDLVSLIKSMDRTTQIRLLQKAGIM